MSDKPTIRIIKRSERDGRAKHVAETSAPTEKPRRAARELAATVTAWVQELQHRRKNDARRGFKNLFDEASPQTGKA